MGARKDAIYEVDDTGPGGATHVIVDSGVVSITGVVNIRALSFATDKVDVSGSVVGVTGSVTVNNGIGVNAVNIQDGGNSITVDGPLTDAQLRATPVPVSAIFTPSGTQDVNLISVSGAAVTLGAKTTALSIPVTLATDEQAREVIIRGQAKGTTTFGDITGTPAGANHQPLDVILYTSTGFIMGQNAAMLVTGTLTGNTKANFDLSGTSNNVPVVAAVSNAIAPTLLEGRVQALSLDLAGNLRTLTNINVNAAPPLLTDGVISTLSSDLFGNLRVTDLALQTSIPEYLALILRELRAISIFLQSGLNIPDDVEQVREDVDVVFTASSVN